MATTVENKSVASFQTDQAVRKKILHLIKRKRPKSEGTTDGGQFNNNSDEVYDDPLTGKPLKMSRTYGRNDYNGSYDSSLNNSEHGRVQCSTCGQMYNSAQLLDKHFRRVHLKERPYLCQFCDYRGFYRREVVLHEQRAHIKVKSYKCPYCDYATTDNESLYSHLATHSTNKAFKCQLCPYACSWKKQLNRHESAHESPEQVQCGECGIVSRDKKQDLVHFSIEHSVKTFTTNVNINKHKQTIQQDITTAQNPINLSTTAATSENANNVLLETTANNNCHMENVQISTMRTNCGLTSQKVMLTSDTVGLSLANLLSMDNDSFSSLSKSPSSNDPQLIISKDEVANHFQVLNVSDLVRKHGFIDQTFIPQSRGVDMQQNQLNDGKTTIPSNIETTIAQQNIKPGKVSLLKSAIRSEVRQKLIEASFLRSQMAATAAADENRSNDVTGYLDSNSDTNSACSQAEDDRSSSDFTSFMTGCDVMPIVDDSAFENRTNTEAMVAAPNTVCFNTSPDPEIDVGSETEADFLSKNNFDSNIIDEILNNMSSSQTCDDNVFYDKPPLPPLESSTSAADAINLESIDRELQSFIEKFERQQAAAAQQKKKKSVLYLDRSDLHEIINLIETKMNGDPTTSTVIAPPLNNFDDVIPDASIDDVNDSQFGNAQVQVVLQVPDSDNMLNTAEHQKPSVGKAVASIELSYLDSMLKQLLNSKSEAPNKM